MNARNRFLSLAAFTLMGRLECIPIVIGIFAVGEFFDRFEEPRAKLYFSGARPSSNVPLLESHEIIGGKKLTSEPGKQYNLSLESISFRRG
jgi:hypothetical protein